MKTFLEFVERKERESLRHLRLLSKMLKNDFVVEEFLDNNKDPYIFINVPSKLKSLSFKGIRIYEIGDCMAYRIQQESETEPYGKAYPIKINEMFNDFMSDMDSEDKVLEEIKKQIVNELKNFFSNSAKAEDEMINKGMDQQNVIMKSGGTDYSNMVLSKF